MQETNLIGAFMYLVLGVIFLILFFLVRSFFCPHWPEKKLIALVEWIVIVAGVVLAIAITIHFS